MTRLRAVLGPLALALTLMAGLAVAAPAADASAHPATTFRNSDGITVVAATHPSTRIWRLTVSTHALARAVHVNVLLPHGYAATTRRYPVLYLFHGTSGGAGDWLAQGNAAAATKKYPMIVVMPDAGYDSNGGSWFTNWVDQKTSLGTANWETFHIDQLVPWIDANLRTIADRSGRAIAGLSQGGFGSTSYAARHPDLFVSAASFSGAPDIASNPVAEAAATAVISATATGLDGVEPDAFFGSHAEHEINWQGHNPATLVTNLRPVDLELWTGNGQPGPYDQPTDGNVEGSAIEAVVHQSTLYFTQAATAAKVAYRLDDYGPGTHSWPYWTRDLAQYLPHLAKVVPASAGRAVDDRLPLDRQALDAVGLDGRQSPFGRAGLELAACRTKAPVRAHDHRLGPRRDTSELPTGLAPPHHGVGRHRPEVGDGGRARTAAADRGADVRNGDGLDQVSALRTSSTRGPRNARTPARSPAPIRTVTRVMTAETSTSHANRPPSVSAPIIAARPSTNCWCSSTRRASTSGPAA